MIFAKHLLTYVSLDNKNILIANSKYLPIRSQSIEYVMCIAMLHHIYLKIDRIQCLREMVRVLKVGGKLIVTVWAQGEKAQQDNMIPWKLQKQHKISDEEPDVYQRYYHLFSDNELINLIKEYFENQLKIIKYYNDYNNWIIICQKLS